MQGSILHIWMSPGDTKKSRYGVRTLGGVIGITALALLLVAGGTVLGLAMGWPAELLSVVLCLGATALAVLLAARVGRRSLQDATIFFLMEGDRLFVVDARRLVSPGRGLLSQAAAAMEVQRFLDRMIQSPDLPAGADEILKVERMRENRSHYVLSCQVRHPNGQVIRRTCFLIKGMEDQELLLRQLERRERWDSALEQKANPTPFFLLISALVCAGCAALCVLSHPAVARLPQDLYFPCLGAGFAALCCLVYFVIRHRRGM